MSQKRLFIGNLKNQIQDDKIEKIEYGIESWNNSETKLVNGSFDQKYNIAIHFDDIFAIQAFGCCLIILEMHSFGLKTKKCNINSFDDETY
jgi:hypothetical protein